MSASPASFQSAPNQRPISLSSDKPARSSWAIVVDHQPHIRTRASFFPLGCHGEKYDEAKISCYDGMSLGLLRIHSCAIACCWSMWLTDLSNRMLRRLRSTVWHSILQHRFRLKSRLLTLRMLYRPCHQLNMLCLPESKHQYALLPIFIISKSERRYLTSSSMKPQPAISDQQSRKLPPRMFSM